MHPSTVEGAAGFVAWKQCYALASAVYLNELPDPTTGAHFYHDHRMTAPPDPCACIDKAKQIYQSHSWGKVQRTVQLGALTFYRAVA
jgi:hypothetical protein